MHGRERRSVETRDYWEASVIPPWNTRVLLRACEQVKKKQNQTKKTERVSRRVLTAFVWLLARRPGEIFLLFIASNKFKLIFLPPSRTGQAPKLSHYFGDFSAGACFGARRREQACRRRPGASSPGVTAVRMTEELTHSAALRREACVHTC